MLKQAIVLLICLMIFSCSPRPQPVSPVEVIEVVQGIKECPRPAGFQFKPLNKAKHLGSPENIEILTGNILNLDSFAKEQSATINCYEAQAED